LLDRKCAYAGSGDALLSFLVIWHYTGWVKTNAPEVE
jgi:hypothetical protein